MVVMSVFSCSGGDTESERDRASEKERETEIREERRRKICERGGETMTGSVCSAAHAATVLRR